MQKQGILILDFGSQYTLMIAKRLRELHVYCQVFAAAETEPAHDFECIGIILSGGPKSVYQGETKTHWWLQSNVPILGICYGMQLLNFVYGGEVAPAEVRGYGKAQINFFAAFSGPMQPMLKSLPTQQTVWMSHSDHVLRLAEGFQVTATTQEGVIAAIAHKDLPILGVQFHPEVFHTEHGEKYFQKFCELCGSRFDWKGTAIVEQLCRDIRAKIGDTGKVLLALSGGVDSSVTSALLAKALGADRVTGVLVDHGLMRLNEAQEVVEILHKAGVGVTRLDREQLFLDRLKGVEDPEAKRKIIGETFIEVFEEFARKNGPFSAFAQGTLYSDVIESAGHGFASKVIKSHHNVGGLPKRLALPLLEPFRFLFKDEVRRLGRGLGLSEGLVMRHPFPGPGLGVRIVGAVSKEKVKILQEADAVFNEALRSKGFYTKVWQAGVVLLPVRSVGVMGDNRTYEHCCVLRAVVGQDGMTADIFDFPCEFLAEVARTIVSRVRGINRVLYDVTSKPPATIEWE